MNDTFANILKTVAPWIATAVTGPLGGLAVGAACDALGVPEKTTDGLKAALAGVTPDQMLALKKADQDFQVQMQTLGFKQITDIEALEAGDRKDARAMQVQTRSMMPSILSCVVTVGFLGLLTGMMLGVLKASDSQALLIMLGALGAAFGGVMQFWFGTTHGSQAKDATIAAQAKSAAGSAP